MAANQDDLEEILKEAMSSYSAAEPLAGIEERIIARIRVSETPRRRMTLIGAALVLGLAGIALSVSFLVVARYSQRGPTVIVTETKRTDLNKALLRVEAKPVPISSSVRRPRRDRSGGVTVLPKKRLFPSPLPITNEEHLLLVLVRRNPDETALAFNDLRQRASQPVEISPLTIPPLPTDEEQ